jgi:hypothetical protein
MLILVPNEQPVLETKAYLESRKRLVDVETRGRSAYKSIKRFTTLFKSCDIERGIPAGKNLYARANLLTEVTSNTFCNTK